MTIKLYIKKRKRKNKIRAFSWESLSRRYSYAITKPRRFANYVVIEPKCGLRERGFIHNEIILTAKDKVGGRKYETAVYSRYAIRHK